MEEKELQQKYMEFQVLQQQIEQLGQQLELLSSQNEELEKTKEGLEELQTVKTGQEMFSQLSPGIFVKSVMGEPQTVLVNVGVQTVVERTIPETQELVAHQQRNVQENMKEINQVLKSLTSDALQLYQLLQAHVQ